MKPVDQMRRILPSHLVRRQEGKDERRETVPGQRHKRKPKIPTGHKADDADHQVDELA